MILVYEPTNTNICDSEEPDSSKILWSVLCTQLRSQERTAFITVLGTVDEKINCRFNIISAASYRTDWVAMPN